MRRSGLAQVHVDRVVLDVDEVVRSSENTTAFALVVRLGVEAIQTSLSRHRRLKREDDALLAAVDRKVETGMRALVIEERR